MAHTSLDKLQMQMKDGTAGEKKPLHIATVSDIGTTINYHKLNFTLQHVTYNRIGNRDANHMNLAVL